MQHRRQVAAAGMLLYGCEGQELEHEQPGMGAEPQRGQVAEPPSRWVRTGRNPCEAESF